MTLLLGLWNIAAQHSVKAHVKKSTARIHGIHETLNQHNDILVNDDLKKCLQELTS